MFIVNNEVKFKDATQNKNCEQIGLNKIIDGGKKNDY
jgi:hypothetical protein